MLTGWLWIHSPDRHRGVDVVCSNRSLVLESTSSVVNKRLLIPQVHQHKKGKITLTTAENSSGRGSEDRPCTHSPACRSIDVVDVSSWSIPRFQASFSRQLNSSEIYVFCSFEWSPCIVPGNRKKVHGIPTRVRKTTVRTTPVRSQQCECQQCERVNSANANSANATAVRMPAVRMRQQCERRFSELCKTVPSVETTWSRFSTSFFVLLYPSFTHKRSTIGARNSA